MNRRGGAMGPVRKAALFALPFLLMPALCVTTAWADIFDPCDSASGPGSYQDLSPADRDYIGWDDPPDPSYLCQQSNRRTASAVYRCSGALEVTVAVYSRYGSYADYSGGELTRGGSGLPLWYQSSTGEVYCDGRRMAYDPDGRRFVFLEEEGRPSGLTEYGLSVYCSEDGSSYDPVSVRLISAWREGPDAYWYEVYRADLEEGTRYLKLALTDQSSIEILGREERYQFETVGGLSLASVEIVEEEGRGSSPEDREPGLDRDPYSGGEWRYEEDGWETGLSDTRDLPAYQPGEEEGSGTLLWGPEEDPEGVGPAFPEESGDQGPEEEPSGESSSSDKAQSSSSPQSQKSGTSAGNRQAGPSPEASGEAAEAAAETGGPAPALRREPPLWRRVTQPDAMTMVMISLALLAMGIRVLWEDGGSGRGKDLARREERYARYMSYDDAGRSRGSRRRETGRQFRYREVRWDDEDGDPDDLDDGYDQ